MTDIGQYKKYILVFLITCAIFIIAITLSISVGNRKVEVIKSTADKISIDILSLETQFEIFQESSCDSFSTSILSDELADLGSRLNVAENERGVTDEEVITLKKYYSLLEIKDYLLAKKVGARCKIHPLTILYFYSNKTCPDCKKEGYTLTKLGEDHPDLRVYSFDYDLDLNALKALIAVHKVTSELPGLVIDGKTNQGFMDIEQIEASSPLLASTTRASLQKQKTESATTTPTSTDAKQ